MALKVLKITSAQVGGITSAQVSGFICAQMGTMAQIPADMAALKDGIVDDQTLINSQLAVPSGAAVQAGIVFVGDTTTDSTSLTNFVVTTPSTATIGQLVVGSHISGPGIQPGTRVTAAASTTVTLSLPAYKGRTGETYICTPTPLSGGLANGTLTIPNRGVLKVLPGDYVFLDVYGFPYLAPATSVGTSGATKPWLVA